MGKEKNESVGKRKKKKSPLKVLFVLVAIPATSFLFWSASHNIFVMVSLQKEIAANTTEIKNLTEKQDTLAVQRDKLKDPNYITRYARSKYLVSKLGEQVFKLPSGSSESTESTENKE